MDRLYPILEHEYNSMIHEYMGYSPNQLRFGIPLCGIADLTAPPRGSSETMEELAKSLKNTRDDL